MKLLFPHIKIFYTIIFLTFSLITGSVYSQNQWQKLFGPFKGQVNDFVVSPTDPDIIIIVSDIRGNPLNIVHVGINPVSNVVEDYRLYQNYPNPFNPETKIKFIIPLSQNVKLKIYNSLGKEIKVLINEKLSPGLYEFTWNAPSFPSGVYFYRLETENFIDTKKLILLK